MQTRGSISEIDVVKRALLAGVSPFNTFAEIVRKPDTFGPLICMILLTIAHILGNSLILAKIFIYNAKGQVISPPNIIESNGNLRVIAVSASAFRKVGPPTDEHYAVLNVLALGFSILAWISWSVSLWISLKLIGGSTGMLGLVSGYVLSAKFYEITSKTFLISLFLRNINKIELFISQDLQKVTNLLNLASIALSRSGIVQKVLMAHTTFFVVWSIVVSVAAISQSGFVTAKKAVVGGIIGYLISSFLQSMAFSLLTLIF